MKTIASDGESTVSVRIEFCPFLTAFCFFRSGFAAMIGREIEMTITIGFVLEDLLRSLGSSSLRSRRCSLLLPIGG